MVRKNSLHQNRKNVIKIAMIIISFITITIYRRHRNSLKVKVNCKRIQVASTVLAINYDVSLKYIR